jgi:Adenylate cyclase, family 3 (some proteins contain HAMP domain)
MGVHGGAVSGVIDVSGRANIAGPGINMAQRVMDCGDADHILLSKRVAEDIEQYAHWQPLLHELGECEVKHGVTLSLVNLYTDELGNPEPPEKFKKLNEQKQVGASAGTLTDAIGKRSSWAMITLGCNNVSARIRPTRTPRRTTQISPTTQPVALFTSV